MLGPGARQVNKTGKELLAGKCFDTAMKEIKLPKYEKWANYDAYLPGNIQRFYGRGY
jgi:hypothetical protein